MEQKKIDFSQLIGLALIGAVLVWYSLTKSDSQNSVDNTSTTKDEIVVKTENKEPNILPVLNDSLISIQAKEQYGSFAYAMTNGTNKSDITVLENEVLKLEVANKGGQIVSAQLKKFTDHNKKPLYLIQDHNSIFDISFTTRQNQNLHTKDLTFSPIFSKNGENQVASFKLKVSESQYLEYRYELKPNEYMIDFSIRSVGLEDVINSNSNIHLNWDFIAKRQEKSIKYENQMTALHYERDDEKFDELSKGSSDDETEEDVNFIAFKQHFFSTILINNNGFKKAKLASESLVKDVFTDTLATKKFNASIPLNFTNGSLQYDTNLYMGPNVYKDLKKYDQGIENIIDLGWGIFGWINRNVFIPIFDLLSSFISNYGLVIILMTIVVRLLMSPLVYKSYVSSAKMKVLKPEMDAINAKFPGKENQMKRQSEIMALQRKSGVNMMAGCIPALLQMPVFFALFRFFPSEIKLRQQPFLWADDLSSYDSVFEWTTNIPVLSSIYGNHFSLFPVLASIAIFFYMRMNQSQQMNMQQPTQEGMPDMQKMMKAMMYFSPIMMLFFFNNYASGLSLYYFVSNILTLSIMLVIKNYVIDEQKILTKIQENRKAPKKQSKFRERLDEAMKQAQAQQATQQKRK